MKNLPYYQQLNKLTTIYWKSRNTTSECWPATYIQTCIWSARYEGCRFCLQLDLRTLEEVIVM